VFLSGANEKSRKVFCYDAKTGKAAWAKDVVIELSAKAEPPEVNADTGFAASTMATDGKRVFAVFANGDVAAFDMDGKPVWQKALGKPENMYGHASSPAIYQNLLIIQYDQGTEAEEGLSYLLALDTTNGKTLWRTDRPVPNSWSSPIIVDTGKGAQIITCANPYVIAYAPGTGKELWRTSCLSGDVAPTPCYGNGLVFACQDGAGGFAIQPPQDTATEGAIAWKIEAGMPDTVSPVCNDELLFTVASYGMVTCYDMANGQSVWEHDMKAPVTSSPIMVGGFVYLTDDEGVTHIFEASREYKAIGSGKLGEKVATTPAMVAGHIYMRGEKTLYCIATKDAKK